MADNTTGAGGPTESEDAIRHLKASQSVEMAFQGAGFPSPPGDIAAIVTNHVKSAVKGLPISQVANMSPGSGALASAATAAVDQFVSSLTPTQREAVRNGANPLDHAAMLKFGGELNQMLNGKPGAPNGGMGGSNGARAAAEAGSHVTDGAMFKGDLGAISLKNYGGSVFEQKGLSFSTFDALRKEKFGADNIVHAAEDAKLHGFDPNDKKMVKNLAILDQDDGKRRTERNKIFTEARESLHNDDEAQRLKTEYGKATTDEERAQIKQKYQQRGEKIYRKKGAHRHIETMPTPRAKAAGEELKRRSIEDEFKANSPALTPGDPAVAKKTIGSIHNYARNPNDAAARRDYKPLMESAAAKPATRAAAIRIAKIVDDKIELDRKIDAKNEVKVDQIASSKSAEADLFADLTNKSKPNSKTEPKATKITETKSSSAKPQGQVETKSAPRKKMAGLSNPTA